MSDTLVLSPAYEPADFLPLSVIPWQEAIKLWFLEKVKVLHVYENRWINSPKIAMQMPAVVITHQGFHFRKGKVRYGRNLLFLRDLYQCAYCGEQHPIRELTVDHVVPKCQGGKTTWANTVTSCKSCNAQKGHKLWTPRFKPFVPDYYTLVGKRLEAPIEVSHSSWIPYLSMGQKKASKIRIRHF